MGNHSAGAAAVATAMALLIQRDITKISAIAILDIACEPHRGRDIEFDDATMTGEAFGDLMVEAFDPGVTHQNWGEGEDLWFKKVYRPFKDRYGFC